MGIGSKLAFGGMTEKIGARLSTVICVALQGAGVGLMALPFGTPSLWAGVFVFGLGFGGLGALIVLLVSETFGLKAFGAIMGLVSLALTLPQFIGPIMAGTLYDATGGYRLSFGIVIAVFAVGIAALLAARPAKAGAERTGPGTTPA
jgi:MFS family permease